jgi:hypothetical protein
MEWNMEVQHDGLCQSESIHLSTKAHIGYFESLKLLIKH